MALSVKQAGEQDKRGSGRWHLGAVVLTVIAVVLALAGGLVPGIAHQVQLGRLPTVFEPEQYLGPPYVGSISGSAALTGAVLWSALALTGVILTGLAPRLGVALLGAALVVTALINVVLPLWAMNLGWSLLGLLQTVAIAIALCVALLPTVTRTKLHTKPTT